MKKYLKQLKVGLLSTFFLFTTAVHAESPVWKVSKGDDHLFIGGTIHLLSKDDYPLPVAFSQAYQNSEKVVFETEMQRLNSPEVQALMMQKMSYPAGQTLKDVLSSDTYNALSEHLNARGIPLASVQNFKPSMIMMILTVLEVKRLGMSEKGVDQFYNNKALEDKKRLGKLETVEQQIDFLSAMGEGNEDNFIKHSLQDMEEMPKMLQELRVAWKTGNLEAMNTLGVKPMKEDYPALYQMLLVDRNNAWMPKIETMLKTKEIEMILVGALHLVGEKGILTQLKAQGYKIEQY